MQAQKQTNTQTSGQNCLSAENIDNIRSSVIPFLIDGCTVSFTPTRKGTDEPMKAVKDILMSAYRTKRTNR